MVALRLSIENETSLPDGGPLSYTVSGRRGIDIGRDKHLDWVLPDPTRMISGKHCEIRHRDGAYWLHDVSSNGTFINGASSRPVEATRLRHGDRLEIGRFLIAVEILDAGTHEEPVAGQAGADLAPAPAGPAADLWSVEGDVAPAEPVGRRFARRPPTTDFIDSAADIARPLAEAVPTAPAVELDWVRGPDAQKDMATGAPRQPDTAPGEAAGTGEALAGMQDFIARFERGAGLPAGSLAACDSGRLAEDLGRMMLTVTCELKALMEARTQAKGAMRSARHTVVQALDNNPIPFAPTAAEALKLMLLGTGGSYLAGDAALNKTFAALKSHQMDVFVAMQGAVDGLLQQLDPSEIAKATDSDTAVGRLFASRGARLWDAYRARWDTLSETHPDGLRGVFLTLFTESYDKRPGRS